MPKFIPRGQISAKELNRQAEQGRRTEQFKAGGIARAIYGPGGQSVYVPPDKGFWARLTSKSTGSGGARYAYAWTQYVEDGAGIFTESASGLAGTTALLQAYEINNQVVDVSEDDDNPTIVWLRPSSVANTFLFMSTQSAADRNCLVISDAVTDGGIRYYPANFRTLDPSTNTFDDDPKTNTIMDCWLVQDKDYDLTVSGEDGAGCYHGTLQIGLKSLLYALNARSRPVYVTTEAPFMGEDCVVRN